MKAKKTRKAPKMLPCGETAAPGHQTCASSVSYGYCPVAREWEVCRIKEGAAR